ncbi:N-acetyltransferase family protein [Actinokineospora sp. NPDC004072]
MQIRPLAPEDLPTLLDLTCQVFEPFYEDSFRPVAGEVVFANRHGDWRGDYRRLLAGAHNPDEGRHVAVAWVDGQVAGYVGWIEQAAEQHGEIEILAVAPEARRAGVGRALVEHAVAALKSAGVGVVSIGTGGDAFHAPARALYESLGFTPFPTVSYTKEI